jgi:hypothetical protein
VNKKMTIVNRPTYLMQSTAWKPTAWLPNREGFRFIGLADSGTEIVCEVVRDWQGVHTTSPVGEITPADESLLREVVWKDLCSSPPKAG